MISDRLRALQHQSGEVDAGTFPPEFLLDLTDLLEEVRLVLISSNRSTREAFEATRLIQQAAAALRGAAYQLTKEST